MPEPTDPAREPLWHGYSYADIDDVARLVIRVDRYRSDVDSDERYLAVRFAIIEHLATAVARPVHQDLVNVGRRASDLHVRADMHTYGWDRRRVDLGSGALPGFQRYWQAGGRTPIDERVLNRGGVDSRGKHLLTESELDALRERIAAGEKQYVLAAEVGYTPGALSHLLNGRRKTAPAEASS